MTPAGLIGKGDIEAPLEQVGASLADVVGASSYRMNLEQWQDVGRSQ